ncbi:unnamed protein product, partial [Iphiclides podalirius]
MPTEAVVPHRITDAADLLIANETVAPCFWSSPSPSASILELVSSLTGLVGSVIAIENPRHLRKRRSLIAVRRAKSPRPETTGLGEGSTDAGGFINGRVNVVARRHASHCSVAPGGGEMRVTGVKVSWLPRLASVRAKDHALLLRLVFRIRNSWQRTNGDGPIWPTNTKLRKERPPGTKVGSAGAAVTSHDAHAARAC